MSCRARRARLVALVVAVLAAAACGQKAGVSGPAAPLAAGVGTSATEAPLSSGQDAGADSAPPAVAASPAGATVPAPAPVPDRTAGATRNSAAVPAPGPGTSTAASAQGRSAGPPPAPGATAGSAPAPPSGGSGPAPAGEDRTGVSDTEIVIGLHAPITGAAPVPQDSLEKAKGLYWRFVAEHGGIFGRNVRVVIKDDQFNPTRAVQVCREMVERDKVFLLMGIGTDQTIACARYASEAGVPYFATGGSEAGFADLSTYFNVSMTFPQQAPMVARVVQRASLTKVGVLTINTPNYNDTHSALEAAARAAGLAGGAEQPDQQERLPVGDAGRGQRHARRPGRRR